ncbi:MAG: SRPBCC family protein [Proteobacteria bacterium]|nr:SRPBCC family protein [Pseudomonadota bacterium]
MRFSAERLLSPKPEIVLALLHDVGAWGFLPGSDEVRASDAGGEVQLVLRGPRPLTVRLEVQRTDDGLRASLIEGDLKNLRARCTVVPEGEGSRVALSLELQSLLPVPGCLVAELDEHVLGRWLDGLAAGLGDA